MAIDWISGGVSGDWATASDWVGGVVPVAGDDVDINATGTYTVTVDEAQAAKSLTIDDADVTVADNSTLTMGGALTVAAGLFQLNSGTIVGGTLSATGGAFQWNSATLSGVTYEGTLDLSETGYIPTVIVGGAGITLTGANGTGAGTVNLTGFVASLQVTGGASINNATIDIGNSGSGDSLELYDPNGATPVLTLGNKLIVDQVGALATIGADPGYNIDTVVNTGTIEAAYSGGVFTINAPNFVNDGAITISSGDTINLYSGTGTGTFTEDAGGSFTVGSGGLLAMGYNQTTAQLASITNKGAIAIDATLTNGGSTLTVGSGTSEPTIELGDPSFSSGAIVGGTIVDKGSGMVFDTGSLSDVTYDGTMDLSPANSSVYVSGGLTEFGENGSGAGEINLTGAGSTFNAFGGQTLNNATMDVGNSTNQAAFQFYNPGDANPTLTLGSSFAIVQTGGAAAIYGVYNGAADQLVNDGSITAAVSGSSFYIGSLPIFTNNGSISVSNSDTLTIAPTVSFTEGASGTLSVASGGTLNLNFALTTAQLLKISDSAGVIGVGTNSTGTLTNTGATLTVGTGAADPTVVLGGNGTIVGGTIVDKGSGLQFGYGATLSGVTYDGTLNVNQSLNVTGGLTVNAVNGSSPGVINDTSYNTGITFDGGETIDNATLDIGYYSSLNVYNTTANNTVLTLGGHFTVDQVGPISTININNLSLINDGTITVGLSGGIFDIYGANFTNNGTIAVSNGDSLTIQTTTFTQGATGSVTVATGGILNLNVNLTTANLAGVTNSGGTVGIQGTLTNTGATLTVGPGTAEPSIDLDGGGEIVGGTIVDKGSGIFFNGGTLSGVTYDGVMDLSPEYSAVTVTGGLTVTGENGTGPGVINLTGFITDFNAFGGQTLNDATLNMGYGATLNIVDPDGLHTTLTFGSKFSIVQSSNGGNIGGGSNSDVIVNDGTITAGVAGNGLSITPTNFTNNGSLIATTGGLLTVQPGTLTNLSGTTLTGGTFEADAGSTIELNQNAQIVTLAATVILNGSGSTIQAYDQTTSAQLAIDATLTTIAAGGALELLGGRDWTTTAAMSNAGTLDLGGATFTAPSLTNTGTVTGSGVVAATMTNTGAIDVGAGQTLSLPDALTNLTGTTLTDGSYIVGAGATLQLANNVAVATLKATIDLAGTGATIQSLDTTTSKQVTLQSSLKTIGATGDLEILGGGAYTTTNAVSNSGTIQLGGGTLTSGKLTDATSSNLEGFGTVASVFAQAGTVTASGGALIFTGSGDTFAGALRGSQIIFKGGTDALSTGTSVAATTWTLSSRAAVSVNADVTDTGALSEASGTTLTIATGDTLTLSGTGSTIAGTITDPGGTLTFGGGTQAINTGAAITTTNWTLSGGAKVSVNENLTYAGTFTDGAGTTLTIAAGDTLTLTGAATFAGTVNGGGALVISGATDTLNTGASLSAASIDLTAGATLNVGGAATIGGAFSQAAGATVSISTDDTLTLSGTGSTLAGAVGGGGTLALSGGSYALNDVAGFTVTNWSLSSGATATLAGALTYGGALTQGAGTTLALGANDLTLSGAGSNLAGLVTGTATLAFSGGTDTLGAGASLAVSSVSLSSNASVSVTGAATTAGTVSEATGTTLSVAAGDTLTLTDGGGIFGAVDGPGVLALSGATTTFSAGANVAGAGLTLENAAVADIDTTIVIGDLSAAAGTSLAVAGGDTVSVSGSGSTLAGKVNGAGALSFSGGTQALNAGATIGTTKWTLSGDAATSVNENLSYLGTFSQASGASLAVSSGRTLTLSGASAIGGAISGVGALTLSGATDTLNAGASLSVKTLTLANGASINVDGAATISGALISDAGTTVTIGSGDNLTLDGTGDSLAGGIAGSGGSLAFTGGTQTFGVGASLTAADWSLSGTSATTIAGNLAYGGAFTQSGAATVSIAAGHTLTLAGTSNLSGAVGGAGTLILSGGTATIKGGASFGAVTLTNAVAAAVNGNATIGGTFAEHVKTSLAIRAGVTLTLSGTGSTIASPITGDGTLSFAGGSQTLNSGAGLALANWSISGGAATAIDESLTYAFAFTQGAGTTLSVASGHNFALTGSASLAGEVDGPGRFTTKGTTSLAGLTLGGATMWLNYGTATQTATTTLGDGVSGAVSAFNTNGATWNITGDSGVALAGSGGTIANHGLLEKTGGTGDSVIAAAVTNAGSIAVSSGVLEFSQAVTGAGSATIANGGILKFDAGFGENVTFAGGATGTLELADSQAYAGKIAGLSKIGANSLDLLDINPNDTPTWSYSGTTTSGVLTVTDSLGHKAAITLEGDYLGQSFTLSAGADGGTKVVDPPAQGDSGSPATTHQFIAAMAGFVVRPAATAHVGSHLATAIDPVLVAPISHYSA